MTPAVTFITVIIASRFRLCTKREVQKCNI